MKKMFEMKCETIINITEANVEDGNFNNGFLNRFANIILFLIHRVILNLIIARCVKMWCNSI